MRNTTAEKKQGFRFPAALWKASVAVILFSTIMVTAYMVTFATEKPRLSKNPSDWGVFGDYVGGTLGAFFGFAAFVGVLVTIAIQRQQLDHARKQAYLDELQRLLSSAAERISETLNREIEVGHMLSLQRSKKIDRRVTLFSMIAGVGYVGAEMLAAKDVDQAALKAAIEDIGTELPLLATDLEYLAICMRTYQHRGGDSDIVNLYRLRYHHVVGWLRLGNFALSDTIVSQFPIQEFVQQMKTVRRTQPSSNQ
jgi:hypothetical protein